MDPCHPARTGDSLAKPVGSDNGCKSNFAISEEHASGEERSKRRAPPVGLRGGRGKRHRTIDRFLARVQKHANDKGCWIFAGAKCCPGGHIYFAKRDGSRVSAHRYAYQLRHGKIPAGKVVMHTCDVAACVNPAHLKIGTQRENVHDAIGKGRFAPWASRRHDLKSPRMVAGKEGDPCSR